MTLTEKALRQEWETPDDFFAVINAEFNFELDACATHENTKVPDNYFTKSDDALSDDAVWVNTFYAGNIERVFCNPGFSKPFPWFMRSFAEAQKFPSSVVVQMGLLSSSTDWAAWCDINATEIRELRPRVNYIAPPGIDQTTNPRECAMYVFRRKVVKVRAHRFIWEWKS